MIKFFQKRFFLLSKKAFYSNMHKTRFSTKESTEVSNPDDFLNKEQYLKKITEQREKEEKEEEESQKLQELYIKMKRREYEVSLSRVDFAKIETDNINLIPKDNFQTSDELFYFLKNLTNKVSEQNIEKCVKGLISLSDKIDSKELENVYYKQFISLIRDNIDLISESRNYLIIAKFLDLFCVTDSVLWEKFERKIINKQHSISLKDFIEIFLHFSNQMEGSSYYYDRCEEVFQANFEKLTFKDFFYILQGYFNAKYGTKEFMVALQVKIKSLLNEATPQELIKLVYIYNKAQGDFSGFISLIEEKIRKNMDKLSFDDLSNCGIAFGLEDFSSNIFALIEERMMKDIVTEINPLKIKQILESLAYNYKGSKQMMMFLKPHILSNILYFSPIDLAKIVKSYYIIDAIPKNDDFFRIMEKKIVVHLKDINNIKPDELMEFVRSYCVTRNGSREFYKLLELVVNHRFRDIIKNPEYIHGMYDFYSTSGFCSPELLKKFEILL